MIFHFQGYKEMRYMFCLMKFLYEKTMIKILKIINIFSSNTLEDSDIFLYPPLIHKEKITLNSVEKKFHSIVLIVLTTYAHFKIYSYGV